MGKQIRVDPEFAKMMKEIQLKRVRSGRDDFVRPVPQITRAMMKHKDFQKIIKDILEVDK